PDGHNIALLLVQIVPDNSHPHKSLGQEYVAGLIHVVPDKVPPNEQVKQLPPDKVPLEHAL
ncbi:MAG: hypothetical protein LBF15_04640, partial [Candidatus Peribacteria bacterium]|nr:hypothetical protein [Candidatus Peribacteria bacterium]